MNHHYLYLILDLAAVSVPLVFSFYPKAPFYRKWKYLLPSTLVPGIIFLAWDEYFTRIGIWGFNQKYLTGIMVGSLPVEELLFFLCIPYACLFTYEALNFIVKKDVLGKYGRQITTVLIFVLSLTAVMNLGRLYTSVTFLFTAVFLGFLLFKKASYLGRFYFTYLLILIPFFTINGILTGSGVDEPVVWYNNDHNLGIRLGTIPVEDVFYGMLLLIMNVAIFESLQKRGKG